MSRAYEVLLANKVLVHKVLKTQFLLLFDLGSLSETLAGEALATASIKATLSEVLTKANFKALHIFALTGAILVILPTKSLT